MHNNTAPDNPMIDDVAAFVAAHGRLPRHRHTPETRQARVAVKTPEQRIDELAAWVANSGRRPARSTDDQTERSHASWLQAVKAGMSTLDAAQMDRLRAVPNVAAYLDTNLARQRDWISELEQFVAANGRRPNKHTGDNNERTLAHWLANHKKRATPLTAADHERLHAMPAIAAFLTRQPTPSRLTLLEQFVTEHGHLPAPDSTNADEAALAAWLRR